jgi:hypothetical protein
MELLMIGFGMCYSRRKCLRLLKEARVKKFDVGIVPGVPFVQDKWNLIMKARVCWAKFLFDKGIIRNVIFSGAAVYTPYVEGEIMAMYAIAMGIPPEHVFVESDAEHSTENILYSFRIAKKKCFNTVAIVSDSCQSRMLSSYALKKVSKEISLIPVVYSYLDKYIAPLQEPVIDPKPAFVENFVALPERESLRKRLNGTRGNNAKKEAED